MPGIEAIEPKLAKLELQLDQFRRVLPTGDAFLLDPYQDTVVDPSRPPQLLSNDSRLSSGYQYLRGRGADTKITIFFGQHVSAENLGNDGRFERLMDQSDAYGFEYSGWKKEDLDRLGRLPVKDVAQPASFFERPIKAAKAAGRPVFSYDVEELDENPEWHILAMHRAEGVCKAWGERISEMPGALLRRLITAQIDLGCVATALREWYMVGRMGYELQRRPEIPDKRPLNVLITVGAFHRDLVRKFRLCGTLVASEGYSAKSLHESGELSDWQHDHVSTSLGALATGLIPRRLRMPYESSDAAI